MSKCTSSVYIPMRTNVQMSMIAQFRKAASMLLHVCVHVVCMRGVCVVVCVCVCVCACFGVCYCLCDCIYCVHAQHTHIHTHTRQFHDAFMQHACFIRTFSTNPYPKHIRSRTHAHRNTHLQKSTRALCCLTASTLSVPLEVADMNGKKNQ
jgi:hypothetical protein